MKKELRKIDLNYQGKVETFYRHSSSDDHGITLAVLSLERKLHLRKGALIPYFNKGKEENKVTVCIV